MISAWTFAVLALLLAVPAPASNAQESDHPRHLPIQHRAPDAMSAADRAALASRQRELVETAKIYGYNLEAGNWSYEQTLCAPMPGTVMLHYFQDLPNGTESLFTALVPRAEGRVRIVPVLYRNATTFLPAPKNPHNYALFNELVPSNIARRAAGGGSNWLELSACYAELTGAFTSLPSGPNADIGIAGAPAATIYVDVQRQSMQVTFGNREGDRTYKIWTIGFNRDGRVVAVSTEDRSVAPAVTAESSETSQPEKITVQSHRASAGITITLEKKSVEPAPASTALTGPVASSKTLPTTASTLSAPSTASAPASPTPAASATTAEPPPEPGWKCVLHPADPPSKIVSPPPPPGKTVEPEPTDDEPQSASQDQPPQ